MPRANRHRITGQIWHITQRCHRKHFLLKFARDRHAWVGWLYEARRRFGLCVLDYQVTSNHAHLLVLDRGGDEIAASMQLIAGRTGQDHNRRKQRRGAFWEDRYHATAVDTEEYLAGCLVYIDLNMVRAGVVRHPREWGEAGYREIQRAHGRYRIIDRAALSALLGISEHRLARAHAEWIESTLARQSSREPRWSEAIAVGRRSFVERVQRELGARARYRHIEAVGGMSALRDADGVYGCRFAARAHRSSALALRSGRLRPGLRHARSRAYFSASSRPRLAVRLLAAEIHKRSRVSIDVQPGTLELHSEPLATAAYAAAARRNIGRTTARVFPRLCEVRRARLEARHFAHQNSYSTHKPGSPSASTIRSVLAAGFTGTPRRYSANSSKMA